ncbi:MAG: hypothetical protein FJ315_03875 [SAR202 cluster bacterium]|nr:hypothetical protein [SAR202 cluster bacterium]
MTTGRTRFVISVALVAAATAVVVAALLRPDQVAWSQGVLPPPPGPTVRPKEAEPIAKRPAVPNVSGAVLHVVQPTPLPPLPRVPPIPATYFSSSDGDDALRVRLRVEVGAIGETIQLMYEPIALDRAPPFARTAVAQRVFRWQAYDPKGNAFNPTLLRPLVLELPWSARVTNPSRLLLLQYDDAKKRWLPVVTAVDRERGLVTSRVLTLGLFALVEDLRPGEAREAR